MFIIHDDCDLINAFHISRLIFLRRLFVIRHPHFAGYSNPQLPDIPISPPPSYAAVMKEVGSDEVGESIKN